eukprot:jgi/Mesvir1/27828/Mv07507-RA.1
MTSVMTTSTPPVLRRILGAHRPPRRAEASPPPFPVTLVASVTYVLRLLLLSPNLSLPASAIAEWAAAGAASQHAAAVERLCHLRVLLEVRKDSSSASDKPTERPYRLNPNFRQQLNSALQSSRMHATVHAPDYVRAKAPTAAALEAFALQQWESVLLLLVSDTEPGGADASGGGGQGRPKPPPPKRPRHAGAAPGLGSGGSSAHALQQQERHLQQTFKLAGLLAPVTGGDSGGEERLTITEAGFQFLLQDVFSQLWRLIREYVASAESRGVDGEQVICFLMQLSFQRVGQAYPMDDLSKHEGDLVIEMAHLGLVYILEVRASRWYFPTHLAANLSAGLSSASTWQPKQGFIIVESNYRIYCYTTSPLQIGIIKLFARVEYRLPNLCVGAITRDSVHHAFSCGISAAQIIDYLQKHAHSQVARRIPIVPETVADQIRLWEYDMCRVVQHKANLYQDFSSMDQFLKVVDHARSNSVLLWEDVATRRMVVKDSGHELMRMFIRKLSKS